MGRKIESINVWGGMHSDIGFCCLQSHRSESWISLNQEEPSPETPVSALSIDADHSPASLASALARQGTQHASSASLASQGMSQQVDPRLPGIFDDITAELDSLVPGTICLTWDSSHLIMDSIESVGCCYGDHLLTSLNGRGIERNTLEIPHSKLQPKREKE